MSSPADPGVSTRSLGRRQFSRRLASTTLSATEWNGCGQLGGVADKDSTGGPKVIRGSVVTHRRRCGKAGCRRSGGGDALHESTVFHLLPRVRLRRRLRRRLRHADPPTHHLRLLGQHLPRLLATDQPQVGAAENGHRGAGAFWRCLTEPHEGRLRPLRRPRSPTCCPSSRQPPWRQPCRSDQRLPRHCSDAYARRRQEPRPQ